MRIAFVNTLYPPYGSSGAEATLRCLAAFLAGRGHQCTVLTLSPERGEEQREVDGIPVRYLPLWNVLWPHAARRPATLRPIFQMIDIYNPQMRQRLGRALAAFRPDVVHCHNLIGFSVSAWAAADRLDIPVVQTLHDYNVACPRSAMWRPGRGNCAVPCADCRAFSVARRMLSHVPYAVTSVSHCVMDRVVAAGVFSASVRARIIRGNNPESTGPDAAPPPVPRGAALRLGFIGRLDRTKGVDVLLDALARLPPGSFTLSIAGTGAPDYEAALRAQAASLAGIVFLGHVDAAEFYRNVDLLIIPSVWEDPFPRVFHEGLAFGVPSLVTPLGGLPEAIEPGRTGFVAPEPTAGGLSQVLRSLLDSKWDPASARPTCLAAAQVYSFATIGGQYEAVLGAAASRTELPEHAGEPWSFGSSRVTPRPSEATHTENA